MESFELKRTSVRWLASLAGSLVVITASTIFLASSAADLLGRIETPRAKVRESVAMAARPSMPRVVAKDPTQVTNGPPQLTTPITVAAVAVAPAQGSEQAVQVSEQPAFPAATPVWVVSANGLNVRAEPMAKSQRLGSFKQGTEVTKLDERGSWVKVSAGSVVGWVYVDYLAAR